MKSGIDSHEKHFLKTHGLSLGYQRGAKSTILFENLNLSLNRGELVCFMGPNGIGKSTLIRTLAGLQKPLTGEISIAGNAGVAIVLTDRISSLNMSVYDLVAFGRYPYLDWRIQLSNEDRNVINQAITLVRIKHLESKRLYELSDGQMQMVMIARALAQETPLLLLDEPTAHLDLNNRVEIMNILRRLSRTTNKAILIATHELDLALQTADLFWLATSEKTIHTGIPEDLVLDGSFDNIFQFKGFDLKTGKVDHETHRGISIQLHGEGFEVLWTKNALERSGYKIEPSASISIHLLHVENKLVWKLETLKQAAIYHSIQELLKGLSN
jgi:iron complex transport system ATP-binding protein